MEILFHHKEWQKGFYDIDRLLITATTVTIETDFSSEIVKGGISIKPVALMHIIMSHWSIWKPPIQKKPMNSQILSIAVLQIFDV